MKRESFIFYTSWLEGISGFTAEEQGAICLALLRYCACGEEPKDVSPVVKMAFTYAKPQIDANNAKYSVGHNGGSKNGKSNNPNGRRGNKQETNKELTSNYLETNLKLTSDYQETNKELTSNYQETIKKLPNVNDNDNDIYKEKIYNKKESAASEPLPHSQKEKRFIAPSLEDVREYMQSYVSSKAKQGVHYDFKDEWAEDYCDFYGSKGWKVGNQSMKDWRLAASKWVRSQSAAITTNITHNNYPKIDNNHFEGEYNPHIYDNEEENWL